MDGEIPLSGPGCKTSALRGGVEKRPGIVRHGFTHFELETEVYVADFAKRPKFKGEWVAPSQLGAVALPTVMRKIVEHGLDEGGPLFSQTNSARKR